MELPFLINQKLSENDAKFLLSLYEKEPFLFTVAGDVASDGTYSPTVLVAAADRFFTVDLKAQTVTPPVYFKDEEEFFTKRLYGNGFLRAKGKDGKKTDIFRFTFSVASLTDAAMNFANAVREGEKAEDAMEAVHGAFEKLLSTCPRCGRTLSSPGAPCINCMNKGKLFRKFSKYLKPEKWVLSFSIFLAFISTGLTLVPPLMVKTLVDDIFPRGDKKMLIQISVFLIVLYIVAAILGGFRAYLMRCAGNRIITRLRFDVYEKAQHLPMRFYDRTSTGSVIQRINSDTATLQSFMLRLSQDVVVQFVTLVGILIVMFAMNWCLTLMTMVVVPLIVVVARIFRKKISPYYYRIWRRNSAVSSVLTDTIPCIRVVKSFTNEDNATERFREKQQAACDMSNRAGKIIHTFPAIISSLVNCSGMVCIWIVGGILAMNGTNLGLSAPLTVGLLVSFLSYVNMFYGPVGFFANFSDSTQNALSSTERIMDILDAEPEHDFGHGKTHADMGGRIEFHHVNFAFDRTKKVLKDINLVIEPGEVVGIVGTTGSGKSTLVNLLLRFYDHYDGTITVDGVDIRDIDMQYYRSHIGYVQQEPLMFHDTIYNNIAYSNDKHTVDEVINAADIANAHEFIVRQPNGYDSVLGERGVGLSGGERQRVSIARAMLRNPKMLVFDEATASVDSETEHLIQEAIENLISGRTTIMIAHRLSTLSKATKIVVVDNGSIIECGSPEELMAKKGKYYRLVQIQSMSDQVAKARREEAFEEV